ncbi:MAG: hypothetical protein A2312_03265 [Candidatus Staskawiczbacteria bacterium RIFOXYB2_FULL_32_9]|nr:MAG: hypothetical protein UR22_C0035G0003 [Parcubacteria group bacterium GW2011_GWC2_32_10]OGZ82729.1 MAG: hypothetical protein A2312_03265 [Candidatus Staskawiczbacteria bacterium RIFOXYB2_FULL_32_9]
MRKSTRKGEATLVQILMTIVIIGIVLALLIPAIQAAMENAERSKKRQSESFIAIGDLSLFPEIIAEGSRWKVVEKTDDDYKPIIIIDEKTKQVIFWVVEEGKEPSGQQIFLNGRMWPTATPIGEVTSPPPTPAIPAKSAVKAEKE